jgi:hypothetical protein
MASAAHGRRLTVLTSREASIFACLVDTVAAPAPRLPPVAETDCAFFFDRWMAASPPLNARGMRILLHVIELLPLALGYRGRLRSLSVDQRVRYLKAIERSANQHVRQLTKLIKGAAFLAYYGDDAIMRRLGYDAEAKLAQARELRAREERP